jgi:hypothetical protein
LYVQGKKKKKQCLLKMTPFRFPLFFKWRMHETTSFFPKHAVSFKWKLAPKCVRFQVSPLICAIFSLVHVLDFFNQVPNWSSNFNIYVIKPPNWPNQLSKIIIWPKNFNFFQLKPKLT